MKCNCYKKAIYPIIALLEEADGNMWFATPDYEAHQQKLHDIILSLNTKFTCMDECWNKDGDDVSSCEDPSTVKGDEE